jgi:hypothetical protein
MNWNRMKPPPEFVVNVLVLLSMACLSLAAFILGAMISPRAGVGIGFAVTGVLLFVLAYLNRPEAPPSAGRGRP